MGVSPRLFGMSCLVTFLILLSAIVVQFHNIEVAGLPGQPLMKASLAPDDTKMEVHPGNGGLSPGHLNPKITHDDLHHFSAYNLRKAHPGNGGLSPGHLTPCGMRMCQCKGGRHWFQKSESRCPPGCG